MTEDQLHDAQALLDRILGLRSNLIGASNEAGECPARVSPAARLRCQAIILSDLEQQLAAALQAFAAFSVQPTTPPPPTLAA